jgi:hypothetical protein
MAELFSATMSLKERVKDFNQIFMTILNKFHPANALRASISMFMLMRS